MFEIKGKYRGGLVGKTWLPFSKVVESQNEKNAVDKVYSLMGSEHGLKRDLIKIDEVKAVE
ncbi:50S ribosomal protein L18Ae [uncultured archaeon]|nr:50S ribosomal protein L18Ae [uncultured archaeon]